MALSSASRRFSARRGALKGRFRQTVLLYLFAFFFVVRGTVIQVKEFAQSICPPTHFIIPYPKEKKKKTKKENEKKNTRRRKKSSSSSGAGWSFAVSFASFSVKNESERGVARKPNEVEGTRDARADIDEHRDERDENDDELDEIARGAVSAWTRAIDDRSAPSAQKKRPPTPFWTNDNFVFFFVRNRTATTTIISKARTNENYNRATRKKWKTNGATNSPKDQTERTAGVGEAADDCGATKTRPTSIHSRRTFVDESAISVDFKGNVKKGDDDDDDDGNDEIDSIWTSKWCRKAATGNDSDKRGQVGKTVEEEN